ncbi:hypothetical protein HZA57_06775, partial [Candidatus Poribacteria bacterium]|nr:hypothetical protein [Candidatus Poribacteria bacterium]
QYLYDSSGRRILKRGRSDQGSVRTRYFFHGLTEEVKKQSVANSHTDTAFAFTVKEDGESVADWTIGINTLAYSENNAARKSAALVFTPGATKFIFAYQGRYGTSGTPWNSTSRALSAWVLGACGNVEVSISSANGNGSVKYVPGTGTNSYNPTTRTATVYVGTALGEASATDWRRFERNIEADFEALSSGNAWVDTDGVRIQLLSTSSYRIDELRLSNAMTLEHNTLGPGVIGHIARHRTINSSTYAVTDRYFHYDQVGSIMSETNSAGTFIQRHDADAFGNHQESAATGLWDNGQSGWQHNTKEEDADTGLVYMYHRWYAAELGMFASAAPVRPQFEHPFSFASGNPAGSSDPRGQSNLANQGVSGGALDNAINSCKPTPCREGGGGGRGDNCYSFVCCVMEKLFRGGAQNSEVPDNGIPDGVSWPPESGAPPEFGGVVGGPGLIICYGPAGTGSQCNAKAMCNNAYGSEPNMPTHVGITDSKGAFHECGAKHNVEPGGPPPQSGRREDPIDGTW